jgi:hypothetical protein
MDLYGLMNIHINDTHGFWRKYSREQGSCLAQRTPRNRFLMVELNSIYININTLHGIVYQISMYHIEVEYVHDNRDCDAIICQKSARNVDLHINFIVLVEFIFRIVHVL